MKRRQEKPICGKCRMPKPRSKYSSVRARKCDDCKAADRDGFRTCHRCGESRPLSEYVRHGKLCADCRDEGHPSRFRACFRCFEVKAPREFPLGDGLRAKNPDKPVARRRHICFECLAREAREREQRHLEWQATWEDPETGRWVRICRKCDETKDLEDDFYNEKNDGSLSLSRRKSYRCKKCSIRAVAERKRKKRQDPVWLEKARAKWREDAKSYRDRNPERCRESKRRYMRKIRSDPKVWERRLEDARIRYRLNLEQMGTPLPVPEKVRNGSGPELPAPPLAAVVERLIRREESPNPFDGFQAGLPAEDRKMDVVCQHLDIPQRTLLAWRIGERQNVRRSVAERVLSRAGLLWWDVWNEDTVPDRAELARIARAFGEVDWLEEAA